MARSSRSITGGSSSGSGWGSGAACVGCCGVAYAGALLGAWRCAAAARNAAVSDGSLVGRGAGAAWRGACIMGRVAKSSAGHGAGAGGSGRGGSSGRRSFGPAGRTPPPMSSSAVQGRSLITSSRLSAKRPSSPSSNACFACLAPEAVPPRPLRDALLDPILSHPFEMLTFIDYMELALGPSLGFVHFGTHAQKGRGAGALTICRRRQLWPR